MNYKLAERSPQFDSSNYIAPSADLIGAVVLKAKASVWFQCVLRADNDTITVGENSNIQDGSVLHVDEGYPIQIGNNVTVGHKVMLHGCRIDDNALIGMNAVILNGAHIGKNCIVGANALVTENTVVPEGMMALGSPAKVVKAVPDTLKAMLVKGAEHYVANGRKYASALSPLASKTHG